MTEPSTVEKGGGTYEGIKLLLCENPLPPIDEAIEAASGELPQSNYYTEPYSEPLRALLAEKFDVAEAHIHINAGSELILRQLFDRFGQRVHLLTPTYPLFAEIAEEHTETRLQPWNDFEYDLADLNVPDGTTLVVVVNPNNPNGGGFDVSPLPALLDENPDTYFLVDEAFVDLAGESVVELVPRHENLLVSRTLSKAHSLAGFRVGYGVFPRPVAADLNRHNDAYPLARPSQAAAIETLRHERKIDDRLRRLRTWTSELADQLEALGVRTFPSETYFFLADFSPHDAREVAEALRKRDIYIKPLDDSRLGPGFMRVTTARPEANEQFVGALEEIL
ncbi:MAG: pyridoxal phosphate-dependent aminotransferase [Halobacteriota archaeon]